MIDIFEEKEQPKLYIADVSVTFKIRTRSKKKVEYNSRSVNLKNHPVVLVKNDFPTQRFKEKFLFRVFNTYSIPGEFRNVISTIDKIENVRFSSNLMYKFDYNLD